MQISEWSCRRHKMKIRLHKYEICCVVTIPKSSILTCLYNRGSSYKIVNKIITFMFYLSQVKINSCFLFRRHKRSSINNWYHSTVVVASISCIHSWFWVLLRPYLHTKFLYHFAGKCLDHNAISAKFIKGLRPWDNISG